MAIKKFDVYFSNLARRGELLSDIGTGNHQRQVLSISIDSNSRRNSCWKTL